MDEEQEISLKDIVEASINRGFDEGFTFREIAMEMLKQATEILTDPNGV